MVVLLFTVDELSTDEVLILVCRLVLTVVCLTLLSDTPPMILALSPTTDVLLPEAGTSGILSCTFPCSLPIEGIAAAGGTDSAAGADSSFFPAGSTGKSAPHS